MGRMKADNSWKQARTLLRRDFSVYIRHPHWVIECDHCSQGWRLADACKRVELENIFTLMEHARMHHREENDGISADQ